MSIEEKYIKQDQVNLLVYGPDRPYFKQKQKIYFNLLFLLSEKKKDIKHNKLICISKTKKHLSLL